MIHGPIKVGDFFEFHDFESVGEQQDDLIYTVTSVSNIKSGEQLLFTLVEIDYNGRKMLLTIDPSQVYRLYYSPFEELSRLSWINNGGQWLFLAPADSSNFQASALELAPYPDVPELEELGKAVKIDYQLSDQPFYATEHCEGQPITPVMIAEYHSSAKVLNPTMLLLERNYCDEDGNVFPSGGLLTLVVGTVISADEIVHHPQQNSQPRRRWWQKRPRLFK